MKKSIIRNYFLLSISFGIMMGLVFPVYAGFFVEYKTPDLKIIFIAGCVAAGIIVGLFSFFIGNISIIKIIKTISNRMNDISTNNGDLTQKILISSNDSIGELAVNFNSFMEKLRSIIMKLSEISQVSHNLGYTLAANSEETASAVEEISSNIEALKIQTDNLVDEIEQVNSSKNEIKDSTSSLIEKINNQSFLLTNTSAMVENTINKLNDLSGKSQEKNSVTTNIIGITQNGMKDIKKIVDSINSITTDTKKIVDLIKVINEISEKTNLLSMNASIEAAHAGEAGKGFSVVASEIRKLSESTNKYSKEINNTLKATIEKVNSSVAITNKAENLFKDIFDGIIVVIEDINKFISELTAISKDSQIMQIKLNDLIKGTFEVNESSLIVKNKTDSIEDSILILVETAKDNLNSISEVAIGISEISKEVLSLNSVITINSENISTLENEVNKFKL